MGTFEVKKTTIATFTGAMAAVATPFDSDGNLQTEGIEKYAETLFDSGVFGVFILGTTGEGFSLSLTEKKSLLEAWMNAIDAIQSRRGRRMVSIVNVSSTVFNEIREFAQFAHRVNVDGIGILPPIYVPVSNKNDLVEYIRLVAECAPELPILYYHIPMFTRELPFELDEFLEIALDTVVQLTALKFTDSNVLRLEKILRRFSGRMNIMNGHEESILASSTIGCLAAICATVSLPTVAQEMNNIFDSKTSAESKRASQSALSSICEQAKRRGNGQFFYGLKLLLNEAYTELDFGVPRPPVYLHKK